MIRTYLDVLRKIDYLSFASLSYASNDISMFFGRPFGFLRFLVSYLMLIIRMYLARCLMEDRLPFFLSLVLCLPW